MVLATNDKTNIFHLDENRRFIEWSFNIGGYKYGLHCAAPPAPTGTHNDPDATIYSGKGRRAAIANNRERNMFYCTMSLSLDTPCTKLRPARTPRASAPG